MVFPEKHKAFAQGFYFFVSLQKSEANIRGNKFCANKQVKETKVRKFIVFENRLFPLFVRTFCCLKKKLFLKLFFDHGGQGSVKKKLFRLRIFFLLLVYLKRAYNQETKARMLARKGAGKGTGMLAGKGTGKGAGKGAGKGTGKGTGKGAGKGTGKGASERASERTINVFI